MEQAVAFLARADQLENALTAEAEALLDRYRKLKDYRSQTIPVPNNIDFSLYDADTRELLDEVYSVFGQFSAWKLRNMTHKEPPWKNASEFAGEITHEAMRDYFKTQLVSG